MTASKWKTSSGSGQLPWVVLLLAVAVILPTVCLLWFMGQVVRNERLAIRQKLITVYSEQLTHTIRQIDDKWPSRFKFLDEQDPNASPYTIVVSAIEANCCDAIVMFDTAGNCLYPVSSGDADTLGEPPQTFGNAWNAEFVEQRFEWAAALYEQMTTSDDNYTRLAAIVGKSRCMAKLGEIKEAIDACKLVALGPLDQRADSVILTVISDARLFMLKLTQGNEQYRPLYEETFQKLISILYKPNEAGVSLHADKNLFIAQKVMAIAQDNPSVLKIANTRSAIARLTKLAASEELSLQAAEVAERMAGFQNQPTDRIRRLAVENRTFYGCICRTDHRTFLVVFSPETLRSVLKDYESEIADSYVDYRLVDESGGRVAGIDQPRGEPFVVDAAGGYLQGWKVELYFKSDTFEKAAGERITVYIWTGVLVISLILLSGTFAAKTIVSQSKLNRLKNDFIATVTHELKTPLASMRVLVDTLLEGRYRNQQQVTEYLQLVSTENARLSRLIDNFLTFSRMERNKKAFQIAQADPAQITHAAAEAVKTKLSNGRCHFVVNIDQNLPPITADHDAMVTVLVNLLDNAYKYSYDDKNIELQVTAANGFVEFRVRDNGIGLSRRSIKKIFTKFYQVDRSLSRRTGGCGLGLSIAKFIVDAHKGSISVESKLDHGSTFTVRLPCSKHV